MIMMDPNMDSKQKQQMLNDIDKVEGREVQSGYEFPESDLPFRESIDPG